MRCVSVPATRPSYTLMYKIPYRAFLRTPSFACASCVSFLSAIRTEQEAEFNGENSGSNKMAVEHALPRIRDAPHLQACRGTTCKLLDPESHYQACHEPKSRCQVCHEPEARSQEYLSLFPPSPALVHLPEVRHVTWHRAKRTIVRNGHFHAL